MDETQAVHLALQEIAARVLPQYEADDGALTAAQLRQIKRLAPQGKSKSVRSGQTPKLGVLHPSMVRAAAAAHQAAT